MARHSPLITASEQDMTQDELKDAVAAAAIDEIEPWLERDTILGIGTGSTANLFIDRLARLRDDFKGAVASSEASAERLRGHGIEIFELNERGHRTFLHRWRRRSERSLQHDQGRWRRADP
jgi:hypothetical protein